jgi:hypothetical protein
LLGKPNTLRLPDVEQGFVAELVLGPSEAAAS